MTTYTVAAVAEALGCRVPHVLALIRAGQLIASDISRPGSRRPLWRIADEGLAGFLARRQHEAAPRPATRRRRPSRIVEYV
jgi:hypothetical protein